MKAINKICQILAILASLATIVVFFTNFATIVSDSAGQLTASGAQLGFGTKVAGVAMHKSSKLLFCFLVAALSLVFGAFSFKSKGARYGTVVSSAVAAIFMLVVTLSSPYRFVDADGVAGVTSIVYESGVVIATVLLFVALAASVAHLFIDDYIECAGKKPTIIKRVVQFLRDYKSEGKKIVWPDFKCVLKNTVIVLIMCLIVGAFVWLIDWGLGYLLNKIW